MLIQPRYINALPRIYNRMALWQIPDSTRELMSLIFHANNLFQQICIMQWWAVLFLILLCIHSVLMNAKRIVLEMEYAHAAGAFAILYLCSWGYLIRRDSMELIVKIHLYHIILLLMDTGMFQTSLGLWQASIMQPLQLPFKKESWSSVLLTCKCK